MKRGVERGASGASRALERLKSDTQLAILTVFCVVGSLAIGPFAVFRLIQGDLLVAFADGLLVAMMLVGLVYAWRTGRSLIVGNAISTLLAAGGLVMIPTLGLSYAWLFSLMIAIFLLANSGVAILLSLALIAVLGSVPDLFADRLERLTFFAVAVQVALFSFVFAWRTSRQHRQLDVMANRDPLTGVGNRRALRQEIAARSEAARIGGETAGLAVIDLDHFKDINDRLGHDAGDQVLIDLAGIVNDTMRTSDRFFRYGGEEFVLVMPGTAPEGMVAALEKLQAAIREHLRATDGEPVTVSIGAAELDADDDPDQWLSRADRQLYAAKNAGRDCIRVDQGCRDSSSIHGAGSS